MTTKLKVNVMDGGRKVRLLFKEMTIMSLTVQGIDLLVRASDARQLFRRTGVSFHT